MVADQPTAVQRKRFTFSLRQLLMIVALAAVVLGYLVVLIRWEVHARFVETLAFSPDGRTLAVGTCCWKHFRTEETETQATNMSQVVELVDLRTHSRTVLAHSKYSTSSWPRSVVCRLAEKVCVEFSPDGDAIATTTWHGPTRLWDARTRRVVKEFPSASMVAFSPDGKYLARIPDEENGVLLWDLSMDKETVIEAGTQINGIAFSPDGNVIAVQDAMGGLSFWDVSLRQNLQVVEIDSPPRSFKSFALAFSPDGRTLAASGWEPVANSLTSASRNGGPNVGLLNGVCDNAGVQCWTVADGSRQAFFDTVCDFGDNDCEPNCIAFSPDGQYLAVTDGAGGATIWDTVSTKARYPDRGTAGHSVSLAFSPDGKTIATGSTGGQVILWDVETLTPIAELEVCTATKLMAMQLGGVGLALLIWLTVWFRWCRGPRGDE